jgi:1-acyl-sn-glycerol-3-phosphate acyltransferase
LIILWSFFSIVMATIGYVFTWSPRIPIFLAKHLWSRIMLFLLGARVKIIGRENIVKGQHYLIVSNHTSYSDIPTLFRTLPIYIRFIGKVELRKIPFLGFYMRLAGMIFLDRSNPIKARKSINEAAIIAKTGMNIVIFPEGTTIPGDKIEKFKKGTWILAKEAESTILPIRIRGTHKVWPTQSNLKIRGGKITVSIGKPIPYADYQNKSTSEFLTDTREIIEKL